jgi:tetratricopeptide (TPR) repeat protein
MSEKLREFNSFNDITNRYPEVIFEDDADEETVLKIYNLEINEDDINDVKYLNILGVFYSSNKDKLDRAKIIFERCLNDFQDVSEDQLKENLCNYAQCLSELKDYDKAICIFEDIIKKYSFPPAMHNLAYLYQSINNYDQAIKYYLMAIEHDMLMSYYELGHIYTKLEQFDKAVEIYKKGIEKNSVHCMYALGLYYKNHEKNEDEMLKYLTMTYKHEDNNIYSIYAIYNIINYYKSINDNMLVYYYYEVLKHYYTSQKIEK